MFPPVFVRFFCLTFSRTARSNFSIRLTVRIIPAHKKDRRAKSRPVCSLAQRSTQRTESFSAARFSDILPGSYRQSRNLPVHRSFRALDIQSPRADLTIIQEIFPNVKRNFSIFDEIFPEFSDELQKFLPSDKNLQKQLFSESIERSSPAFCCIHRYWMRRRFRSEDSGFQRPAGGGASEPLSRKRPAWRPHRSRESDCRDGVAFPAPETGANCPARRGAKRKAPGLPGALAQSKERCVIFLMCPESA